MSINKRTSKQNVPLAVKRFSAAPRIEPLIHTNHGDSENYHTRQISQQQHPLWPCPQEAGRSVAVSCIGSGIGNSVLRGISRGNRHCSISNWDGDHPSIYFGQNPSNCTIKVECVWAGETAQSVITM